MHTNILALFFKALQFLTLLAYSNGAPTTLSLIQNNDNGNSNGRCGWPSNGPGPKERPIEQVMTKMLSKVAQKNNMAATMAWVDGNQFHSSFTVGAGQTKMTPPKDHNEALLQQKLYGFGEENTFNYQDCVNQHQGSNSMSAAKDLEFDCPKFLVPETELIEQHRQLQFGGGGQQNQQLLGQNGHGQFHGYDQQYNDQQNNNDPYGTSSSFSASQVYIDESQPQSQPQTQTQAQQQQQPPQSQKQLLGQNGHGQFHGYEAQQQPPQKQLLGQNGHGQFHGYGQQYEQTQAQQQEQPQLQPNPQPQPQPAGRRVLANQLFPIAEQTTALTQASLFQWMSTDPVRNAAFQAWLKTNPLANPNKNHIKESNASKPTPEEIQIPPNQTIHELVDPILKQVLQKSIPEEEKRTLQALFGFNATKITVQNLLEQRSNLSSFSLQNREDVYRDQQSREQALTVEQMVLSAADNQRKLGAKLPVQASVLGQTPSRWSNMNQVFMTMILQFVHEAESWTDYDQTSDLPQWLKQGARRGPPAVEVEEKQKVGFYQTLNTKPQVEVNPEWSLNGPPGSRLDGSDGKAVPAGASTGSGRLQNKPVEFGCWKEGDSFYWSETFGQNPTWAPECGFMGAYDLTGLSGKKWPLQVSDVTQGVCGWGNSNLMTTAWVQAVLGQALMAKETRLMSEDNAAMLWLSMWDQHQRNAPQYLGAMQDLGMAPVMARILKSGYFQKNEKQLMQWVKMMGYQGETYGSQSLTGHVWTEGLNGTLSVMTNQETKDWRQVTESLAVSMVVLSKWYQAGAPNRMNAEDDDFDWILFESQVEEEVDQMLLEDSSDSEKQQQISLGSLSLSKQQRLRLKQSGSASEQAASRVSVF